MTNPFEHGTCNWAVQERFNYETKRKNRLIEKTGLPWLTLISVLTMESKNKGISMDELASEKLCEDHTKHLEYINSFSKINLKSNVS
jgi:hypothetical protein